MSLDHLTHPSSHSFDSAKELTEALSEAEATSELIKPFDYVQLAGSREETGEDLRARYLRYTEKMVSHVLDIADTDGAMDKDGRLDTGVTMVFLDKSARPTYWLMDEFWNDMAPGFQRPAIKFANIDREQWQNVVGRIDPDYGGNDVDVNRLSPDVFMHLRKTFVDPHNPDQSEFNGRKILVVDETRTSGTTLEISEQLFSKTFDDAKSVEGHHWMVRPRGDKKTSEVPVWYDEDTPLGRGVADRDFIKSKASPSSRQQEGAWFLSTSPDEPDFVANQLRSEFKALHKEVLNGTQRISIADLTDEEISPRLLAVAQTWRKAELDKRANA